jgi:hypothetical protein
MKQFFSVVYKFFQNGRLLKDGRFMTSSENLFCSQEMEDLSKLFTKTDESDHIEVIIMNVRKVSREEFDFDSMLKEYMKS